MRYCDVLSTDFPRETMPQNPLAQFMEYQGWPQKPLKHFWSLGFDFLSVMRIIAALPHRLTTAVTRLSWTLHDLAEDSSLSLQDAFILTGCEGHSPIDLPTDLNLIATWDDCIDEGLIYVMFDPQDQVRRYVNVNAQAARMLGFTKEEFLFRFVHSELPLFMSELDWVRMFCGYLTRYFDDCVTQYLRFRLDFGESSECALVRVTIKKTFDCFGRICQVSRWGPTFSSFSQFIICYLTFCLPVVSHSACISCRLNRALENFSLQW